MTIPKVAIRSDSGTDRPREKRRTFQKCEGRKVKGFRLSGATLCRSPYQS